MLSALLYLQFHSLKNRLLMRFKRLKQPKYLLGGIVGALYFYFYFFRYLFGLHHPGPALPSAASPADLSLYESLGALVLLVVVSVAWLVPRERAALAFTEAEVAILFPAPLSRRGLIHFKLFRSQAAIFFTTLFLLLITSRRGGHAWIHALGLWLILSTLNLHFLASSFARTMLLDRGITTWRRRLAILALLFASAGLVLLWALRTLPHPDFSGFDPSQPLEPQLQTLKSYGHQILVSGPLPWLLFPFRIAVHPYLAPDAPAFLRALLPALLLLALHYIWVIRSNVAFEEASVEASRKIADKVAALRAGNWRAAGKQLKVKRAPFTLRSSGSPAVAFFWKNLISAGQAFTVRTWLIIASAGLIFCFALARTVDTTGLPTLAGMFAGMLLIWSLLVGPQLLRQDLRQDLLHAEILKTYPLPGWQLVLGELLAPAAILSAIQWFLLLLAVAMLSGSSGPGPTGPAIIAPGIGAAFILPMLNLLTLQIPNAAVLLFPAWFRLGKEGAQGIEATGQRIISMFGQLLAFIVALIPAAAAFAIVFFPVRMFLGLNPALLLACLAAAIVLAAEAAAGLLLLGWLFERFDVSVELAP
ncbi:MAG TPA: putative ABC exporter domain-containing protein [Candidatus Binatia bacterium]|jgi:ABC-2 type transport system permease protein|nr:putative ABC exporter domain-containing protein [Candidatus Binatia bacterium]